LFEQTFNVNASISSGSSSIGVSLNTSKVEEELEEEQTEFDVILTSINPDKPLSVIKCTRQVTGRPLKECKELVMNTPTTILKGVSKEKAEEVKKIYESEGVPYITIK
jgi:large subunit ribosomal protein L7/L12